MVLQNDLEMSAGFISIVFLMVPINKVADNESTLSLPSNRFDQHDGLEAFGCKLVVSSARAS